jgi:hypothetical protein
MSYNLFLDDIRSPNKFFNDIRTWVVARNYDEFVKIITEQGMPELISFDHDLSFEHYPLAEKDASSSTIIPYAIYKEKTGFHCAKWLVNHCMTKHLPLPKWQIHSLNPIGKENIKSLLECYERESLK